MAHDAPHWCLIESDPGVFTELIAQMGCKGVQASQPIFGLIFLFKWRKETDDRPTEADSPDIFFANQVISNACATQAILSVLLNTPDLELGSALTDLKSFTADFTPALRGEAISNSESIRRAHNSFSPPQAIVPEETQHPDEEGDAFHFICYIHRSRHVWELDGLKAGPIKLGACTESDWLEVAGPSIQERIKRYSQEEIRFNLMAVVKDRARSDLQLEADRHASWHEDNLRRKHNWIPFLFTFLRTLAKQDQLKPLISRARSQETQSEQH
eukprot:jgi/Astpho2/5420/fgenesh1_pm.00076_%23_5_t